MDKLDRLKSWVKEEIRKVHNTPLFKEELDDDDPRSYEQQALACRGKTLMEVYEMLK